MPLEEENKYIGALISPKLYWKIKKKLIDRRLTMSEAIVQALLQFLEIKDASAEKKTDNTINI